jgi:multidrug efflux pump subunit AcrA (membrane-fusion protein)
VNQSAQVYLTGIDEPFTGKVWLLGAIIDPQTRLGEIRISLPESSRIRPGAFARAQVLTGTARRPVLPQTAVLSDSDGTYVLIVNADGKTERRPVTVGDTVAEGLVISEGLTGNERVISTAGAFLRAGEKVKVTAAQQPSAT